MGKRLRTLPIIRTETAGGRSVGAMAALLTLGCVVVHIPIVSAHWVAAPILSAAMMGLTLACLSCLRGLWSHAVVADWVILVMLSLAMLSLHAVMMAPESVGPSMLSTGGHGAGHGQVVLQAGAGHSVAMSLATMFAATQAGLGCAVILMSWARFSANRWRVAANLEKCV